MDVVHLAAVLLQIGVQEVLQGTHRQLDPGIGNGEIARAAGVGVGDGMAHALALVGVGIELHEGRDQLLRLHAEHHPVDSLELQRVIVEVLDLHQGVPRGQVRPLVLRGHLLQIFIAGLGGSQTVIAIAHGEQQGGHSAQAVLVLHGLVAAQALQRVGQPADLLFVELPALQAAALHHQIEVVEDLHALLGGGDGLHADFLGVVDQQHDVGQLNGRILPHPHPGRDALQHRALGSPDEGAGTRGIVVLLQVHRRHQARPHRAVGLGPLDVDNGILQRLENVPGQVVRHGAVDIRDVLLHVGVVELALRQDQPQRTGRVAGDPVHLLPVLRLAGELVAGHHRPLGHIRTRLRQQDVRRTHAQLCKFLAHTFSSIMYFTVYILFLERKRIKKNFLPQGSALLCVSKKVLCTFFEGEGPGRARPAKYFFDVHAAEKVI